MSDPSHEIGDFFLAWTWNTPGVGELQAGALTRGQQSRKARVGKRDLLEDGAEEIVRSAPRIFDSVCGALVRKSPSRRTLAPAFGHCRWTDAWCQPCIPRIRSAHSTSTSRNRWAAWSSRSTPNSEPIAQCRRLDRVAVSGFQSGRPDVEVRALRREVTLSERAPTDIALTNHDHPPNRP